MKVKILKNWFWGKFSLIGWSLAIVVFILDQAHKFWVVEGLKLKVNMPVAVLPFLDYRLVWNKGISYGLLQQTTMMGTIGLIIFALIAVLGLTVYLAHSETRLAGIGVGMIIGGALGNALDRMHWPGVADYFSLHAFGYHWFIFNIADVAIVLGVVALIWDAFTSTPQKEA